MAVAVNIQLRKAKKEEKKQIKAKKKKARQTAKAKKKKQRQEKREKLKVVRKSSMSVSEKKKAKKTIRTNARKEIKDVQKEKKQKIKSLSEQLKEAQNKLKKIPKHKHKKWNSYLGFVKNSPESALEPRNYVDVKNIVDYAIKAKKKVRVVGSGHSFSKILDAKQILIAPYRLNHLKVLSQKEQKIQFTSSYLKSLKKNESLISAGAGITIRDLNRKLEKSGLGLINQGTYEGQRLWGAVSTSTHGSGIELPPFPDMVCSVDMVVDTKEGARVWRIEPKNGPTKKIGAHHPTIDELKKDDQLFYSVITSMGCMGVAVSVIVKVRKMYFLEEKGKLTSWGKIKKQLKTKSDVEKFLGIHKSSKKTPRHIELLVSSTKSDKSVSFLGRKIDVYQENLDHVYVCSHIVRDIKKTTKKSGKVPICLRLAETKSPNTNRISRKAAINALTPNKRDNSVKAVVGAYFVDKKKPLVYNYIDKYYHVFPRGGKKVGGFGMEIAVPYQHLVEVFDYALKKMESIMDNQKKDKEKNQAHFGPTGIRFVNESQAYLSPQYKRQVVMMEFTMVHKQRLHEKQVKAMRKLQESLVKKFSSKGLRVHWGLEMDNLTADQMKKHYPKLSTWKKMKKIVCFHGTFNNIFTKRLKLD